MRGMTSSGIGAAMALLIKDRKDSNIDTLQEDWANPEFLEGVTRPWHLKRSRVKLRISDEKKPKIQVNALVNYPEARYFNETQQAFWIHFLDLAIKK